MQLRTRLPLKLMFGSFQLHEGQGEAFRAEHAKHSGRSACGCGVQQRQWLAAHVRPKRQLVRQEALHGCSALNRHPTRRAVPRKGAHGRILVRHWQATGSGRKPGSAGAEVGQLQVSNGEAALSSVQSAGACQPCSLSPQGLVPHGCTPAQANLADEEEAPEIAAVHRGARGANKRTRA